MFIGHIQCVHQNKTVFLHESLDFRVLPIIFRLVRSQIWCELPHLVGSSHLVSWLVTLVSPF